MRKPPLRGGESLRMAKGFDLLERGSFFADDDPEAAGDWHFLALA